jgi:hypothetical protein
MLLAAVIAMTALFAGCGDDEDTQQTSETTTSATTVATTTAATTTEATTAEEPEEPEEPENITGAWSKPIENVAGFESLTWDGSAVVFTTKDEITVSGVKVIADDEEYTARTASNTGGSITIASDGYVIPVGTTMRYEFDDADELDVDRIVITVSEFGAATEYNFNRPQ